MHSILFLLENNIIIIHQDLAGHILILDFLSVLSFFISEMSWFLIKLVAPKSNVLKCVLLIFPYFYKKKKKHSFIFWFLILILYGVTLIILLLFNAHFYQCRLTQLVKAEETDFEQSATNFWLQKGNKLYTVCTIRQCQQAAVKNMIAWWHIMPANW